MGIWYICTAKCTIADFEGDGHCLINEESIQYKKTCALGNIPIWVKENEKPNTSTDDIFNCPPKTPAIILTTRNPHTTMQDIKKIEEEFENKSRDLSKEYSARLAALREEHILRLKELDNSHINLMAQYSEIEKHIEECRDSLDDKYKFIDKEIDDFLNK